MPKTKRKAKRLRTRPNGDEVLVPQEFLRGQNAGIRDLQRAYKRVINRLVEQMGEIASLRKALRDLTAFYDRRDDSGWVFSDIRRLEEIRDLVTGNR